MPDPADRAVSAYELRRLQKADDAVKAFCRILIDENLPDLPRELVKETNFDAGYEGLLDEVSFWWTTIGANRDGYYTFALDLIERRKPFEHMEHLSQFEDKDIYVLDVGSGPFTTLGTRWDGRELHLSLADPLAPVFGSILQLFRIPWNMDSRASMGERLTGTFAAGTFHLVCARNSLDHSVDPLLCIREMLEVAKPGATVLIRHIENEAAGGGYNGLHQWNFTEENGIPRDGQDWTGDWIEILIEKPFERDAPLGDA
jgi:SAM-dependent methyltransferase